MLNCVIIEDEPLPSTLLATYIQKTPFLRLEASFSNAFDAGELLKKSVPDLLFLDIQLPGLNGLQFLKSLQQKPIVIFTTAFSQYAIEGFELAAIDYLLKPFNYPRFQRAALRARDYHRLLKQEHSTSQQSIYVKSNYQTIKIEVDNILLVESLDNYAKFHLKGQRKPVISINTLKNIMEQLPKDGFIRVHKSFIVPLSKIEGIQRRNLKIEQHVVPIGNTYWEAVRLSLGI